MRFGLGVICTTLVAATVAAFFWPAGTPPKRFSDVTVVFLAVGNEDNQYSQALMRGGAWAEEDFGCTIKLHLVGWRNDEILTHFAEAILYRPDVICVPGYENETGFDELVAEATSKGIRVTTYHAPLREIMRDYQAEGLGFVGEQSYELGKKMAARAALFFGLERGSQVLVMGNSRVETDLRPRPQGLLDGVEEAGLKTDLIDMGDYWRGVPYRGVSDALQDYLEAHGKPDCIFFDSGEVDRLVGAFEDAGLAPGEVPVAVFDGSSMGLKAMKDGYFQLLFARHSILDSYFAVLQGCLSRKYGVPGFDLYLPAVFITQDNIDVLERLVALREEE